MAVLDTGAVLRIPEEGRLVRARGRMWVVTQVDRSNLPTDELGPDRLVGQHVVTLSSIEDDARGETVVVIWEAEPGTEVRDSGDLPQVVNGGFDPPEMFDAYLDAVRWGAITNADSKSLQSPFRAGIDIKDYQLAPLARALGMSRVSLLIADDVGLGKTVEAGLIAQELILRHQATTVMVVCPPSLCGKWQREMDEKFGLRFEIVDSDRVRQIRRDRGVSVNPFRVYPRMIVSIDWLKAPAQQARLEEVLKADPREYPRAFDLLVVDEAHQCAPSAGGPWAKDSHRTRLIRRIAEHFEHRLFLSATPHNGYSESFQALLELVDPLRYNRGAEPDSKQLHGTTMVRRLKSDLRAELGPGADGHGEFPLREIVELQVTYPDDELAGLKLIDQYRQALRAGKSDDTARTAVDFLTLLLKKRFLSSPDAFWRTVTAHALTARKRGGGAWDPARIKDAYGRVSFDYGDDDDLDEALDEATAALSGAAGQLNLDADKVLRRLEGWADAHRGRPDSKTLQLFEWIAGVCDPDGGWNAERLIVFTEYRDTLNFLRDLMGARGWLADDRVEFVFGGMDPVRRDRIVEEFNYDPAVTRVRVLVATDAASEGIDLQQHCHRLLHMEIPFSPTRLEQRNGRVDRYGQPHDPVLIHHFVGRDERANPVADMDFLFRVARKINEIRNDLGSASPVLSRKIEQRLLGAHVAIDDAELDQRRGKAARDLLDQDRRLRRELDDVRVRLVATTAEMGLTPERVRRVVDAGLTIARQNRLTRAEVTIGASRISNDVWAVPALAGTWAETVQYLPDPITEVQRPITFSSDVSRQTRRVVYAHLGHPLVARALRLLRAQTWAGADSPLKRVTARYASVDEILVLAHARVVITGGDGARLHEEVVAAGVRLAGTRRALGVGETQEALDAASTVQPPSHVLSMLADQWSMLEERLRRATKDRAAEVARQRNDALDRRREGEKRVITERLEDLKADIERSLDSPQFRQLTLDFVGLDDGRQFRRDLSAMRNRLERIPGDIVAEHTHIDKRYADRTLYEFPVAVTFLVPQTSR